MVCHLNKYSLRNDVSKNLRVKKLGVVFTILRLSPPPVGAAVVMGANFQFFGPHNGTAVVMEVDVT
jgi:hypothetical protein